MTQTAELAPPSSRPASRRSRLGPAILGTLGVVLLGAVWWSMATPQVTISRDFAGAIGLAATSPVRVTSSVRNDGRLGATVSAGSMPPTVTVQFGAEGTDRLTSFVRLGPGEEAYVVVTVSDHRRGRNSQHRGSMAGGADRL